MLCSCIRIFGKFASIYQTWITTQSSIKSTLSSILHFTISSRLHIYAWWMIFIWYPPQFKVTQNPQVANTPRAWHGSSHAESDELSQTVGQTLSVVVGALSHLWDIATLSSLTAANMHLSEAISRMLESCFIWGKKAEILVQGILREHVNLLLKGPLHNLLLLGPLIDPPHATLCLLILAQFWIWPGCPGGVN